MEMQMNKKRLISAIMINGIVFLSVLTVVLILIIRGDHGMGGSDNSDTFKYFTNLSNIYCAIVSLAVMIAEIRMLCGKQKVLPQWLLVLKHTAVTAVSLTFITVVCFLAPVAGYAWYYLFTGSGFFLHVLDPLLAIFCFVFLEKGKRLSPAENLIAVIPTLCYGALYDTEVVILKNWTDFYGFTFGGKVWAPFVVIPVMLGVTFLLAFLLAVLQRKLQK